MVADPAAGPPSSLGARSSWVSKVGLAVVLSVGLAVSTPVGAAVGFKVGLAVGLGQILGFLGDAPPSVLPVMCCRSDRIFAGAAVARWWGCRVRFSCAQVSPLLSLSLVRPQAQAACGVAEVGLDQRGRVRTPSDTLRLLSEHQLRRRMKGSFEAATCSCTPYLFIYIYLDQVIFTDQCYSLNSFGSSTGREAGYSVPSLLLLLRYTTSKYYSAPSMQHTNRTIPNPTFISKNGAVYCNRYSSCTVPVLFYSWAK